MTARMIVHTYRDGNEIDGYITECDANTQNVVSDWYYTTCKECLKIQADRLEWEVMRSITVPLKMVLVQKIRERLHRLMHVDEVMNDPEYMTDIDHLEGI